MKTAVRLPNVETDQQGWGMVNPRAAIDFAMRLRARSGDARKEGEPAIA
jgi:hypothetical protein